MAVIRENGKLVDSKFINDNYKGRSVLLAFNGENLPVGQGYLVYSSDASTTEEARADQIALGNLLVREFNADGILSSGWGGVEDLQSDCIATN
jgi:hypothetical protein